ncbi:MAG: 50S ribosomal protein L11 methyltransferase [Nitrospirae bacterium]|nr:50S ribosomal protein L11 methyltransferase [Nitrospirota bacterium]
MRAHHGWPLLHRPITRTLGHLQKDSCKVTGDLLNHHREYLDDRIAQALYRRAIRRIVRPGDVVVDLGAGTGIHSMEACRAGARKVYALECGDMAVLARDIIGESPFSRRISVIHEHSSFVRLREKADVIISYLGPSDLVRSLPPARARFLRRGGRTIPSHLRFRFGPVEAPDVYAARIDAWRRRRGADFTAARRCAANTAHTTHWLPSHFLSRPRPAFTLPLDPGVHRPWKSNGTFVSARDGTLHGIGLWFEFRLARGIWLSTRPPLRLSPAVHRHAFLPLERPLPVRAGERLRLRLTLLPGFEWMWRWSVHSSSHALADQSSLDGLLLSADRIQAAEGSARTRLNARGQITQFVLERCRKGHTLDQITAALSRRPMTLSGNRREALDVTRNILADFARRPR